MKKSSLAYCELLPAKGVLDNLGRQQCHLQASLDVTKLLPIYARLAPSAILQHLAHVAQTRLKPVKLHSCEIKFGAFLQKQLSEGCGVLMASGTLA